MHVRVCLCTVSFVFSLKKIYASYSSAHAEHSIYMWRTEKQHAFKSHTDEKQHQGTSAHLPSSPFASFTHIRAISSTAAFISCCLLGPSSPLRLCISACVWL